MKKITQIILLVLLTPLYSDGQLQNLVINGGIEMDSCQTDNWLDNEIYGWGQHFSVDHIHYNCGIGENTDYWLPHKGRGALGFYTDGYNLVGLDTLKNREYPSGRLSTDLSPEHHYSVSYWIKPSAYADKPWEFMTSDQASLAFVSDSSEMASFDAAGVRVDIFPFEPDVVNPYGILYDFENYIQISSCYQAEGDEKYFILGNFEEFGQSQMDTLWKDRSTAPSVTRWRTRAYLLIDDVAVYEVPDLPLRDTLICNSDTYILYRVDLPYEEVWVDDVLLTDSLIITESSDHHIIATTGACEKETTFSVEFASCEDCAFYIPNVISSTALSPDDRMIIDSDCSYVLQAASIYDRWGNVVYSSNSQLDWNGQLSSGELSSGVYVYVVTLEVQTNKGMIEKVLTGSVTVLP